MSVERVVRPRTKGGEKFPIRKRWACLWFWMLGSTGWITVCSAAPVVWIHFDDLPDGSRVDEEYADQGVHFLSDYAPNRGFRCSPQVTAYAGAKSTPNVLVATASDIEFSSSVNVPLVIRFDNPITGVGIQLGYVQSVSTAPTATVTLLDCQGKVRGQVQAQPTPQFQSNTQVLDPTGTTRTVVVDYGNSSVPEAIDALAFEIAPSTCVDKSPPVVQITSHQEDQLVASGAVLLQGKVSDSSGLVARVKVNGALAQLVPRSGTGGVPTYEFQQQLILHEGANPITVLAWDADNNKGSASITLQYGPPATATISQFHLTQRGIMKNAACDVDTPLVAGKSAIVRIALDAKTATGKSTYVTSVEMKVWRKTSSGDVLTDTLQGTTYSPFMSLFNAPNSLAAIHFWVPGQSLSIAGEYWFQFQPYVGLSPLGSPLPAGCAGQTFTFTETKSVRLLILPVEAGMNSPALAGTDHIHNALAQLASLARTFPVRDGFSQPWWGQNTGVYFTEAGPFELSDGSEAMKNQHPNIYQGTGWTWKFIDKDPSGLLRRADAASVNDNSRTACNPNDHNMGGRIASSQVFTLPFDPALGIFRGGAHPSWNGAKHAIPMDEDHDGDIDNADLAHYVSEFYDTQSASWISDLTQLQAGETFRFFRDLNGNNCNDSGSEPQADVRLLWEHAQNLLWGPAGEALTAYNQAMPGTANDAGYCSLWFPVSLTAFYHPEFGSYGPGQGQSPGQLTWIVLRNTSTMPHEVGHNVGGLKDLYLAGTDPAPDDLVTKENAWAAYVGYDSVPPAQVYAAMGADARADRVVHYRPDYQVLFDKLKVSSPSPAPVPLAAREEELFSLRGWIQADGQAVGVRTSVASGLTPTLTDRAGLYTLVLGSGRSILVEYPFNLPEDPAPPEGFETWPISAKPFEVVVPFPSTTEWVELRRDREVLGRFDRPARAPTVQVLSPNGGERFTGNEEVTIRWSSEAAEGIRLLHNVYYSPDVSGHWITLGASVAGTQLVWKLSDSPGTPNNEGRIRVVVSDGFNSAEDQSDGPFRVAGKPPLASILSPHPGQTFLQCQRIQLQGAALDPEGQPLRTTWNLDGVAVASSLTALVGPWPPGDHLITLKTIDNQNLVATHEVNIVVEADSDCDGMSDAFEEEHGLEPGFAEDAGLDKDGDGLMNFEEAWHGTDPNNLDTDGDGYPDGQETQLGSSPLDTSSTPNPPFQNPLYLNCGGIVTSPMHWAGSGSRTRPGWRPSIPPPPSITLRARLTAVFSPMRTCPTICS